MRDQQVAALKAQGMGINAIARQLGMAKSTAQDALKRAALAASPVRVQATLGQNLGEAAQKPRVRIAAATSRDAANANVPGAITRVTVIPDTHLQPGVSPERMRWIGRHVAAQAPDELIHIGDLGDFESLCSHTPNDTFGGKLKPTFLADCAAVSEGLEIMAEAMAGMSKAPRQRITLGNHDNRLWRFENSAPEICGMMQEEFIAVLRRFGWEWHMYGEPVSVAGVRYVHIPLNIMGREVGGKFAGQTIARESVWDVVHGHTHRGGVTNYPKLFSQRTRVIDVGACMPDGFRPSFAANTQGEWDSGIVDIIQRDGKIVAANHIPTFELERRYG